ncbi:hypothetical protein ACS3UN_12335 [Oscillospiraceae bacterium LTW-04]|nr:hypothetical protein RBH76_14080 [Oscillospiraceae bacterium MB24-C1]WMJ83873.1 hypothetical protein RBH76_00135 [Oscillospiraceae bacterium MB24-C1]
MAKNLKFPEAYHILLKCTIEISELQLVHDINIVPLNGDKVTCHIAFATIIEYNGKFYSGEIISPELLCLC